MVRALPEVRPRTAVRTLRGRCALVAVLALAVVGIVAGPVAAQPPPTGQAPGQQPGAPGGSGGGTPPVSGGGSQAAPNLEAAAEAVNILFVEVATLEELGAFGPAGNPTARDIADAVDPGTNPAGLPLGQLLTRADAAGAKALSSVTGPSLEVSEALGPVSVDDLAAVNSGGTVSLPVDVYLFALDDLIARGGRPPVDPSTGTPLPVSDRTVDSARVVGVLATFSYAPVLGDGSNPSSGSTTSGRTTENAATSANSSSSTGALPIVIVLVVVGIVALVVAAWLLGRARRDPQPTERNLDDMLEISRQLARATEAPEVAELTVREAMRLTHASAGAFVVRDGERLLVGTQHPDGVLVPEHLTEGLLGRVVDTGQPIATVSATEQALANLPASLLAAPVIARGSVAAVILVVRRDDNAFGREETDVLVRLAPIVASALESAQQRGALQEMTLVDPLTSIGNRRAFDRDASLAVESAATSESPCSMIMIDVDHFKQFNDSYGHAAGDAVLRTVGKVLADTVRPEDRAYRYGGEEFAVLLASTPQDDALAVAERLREAVQRMDVGAGVPAGTTVTASFGVASTSADDVADLQRRADDALYQAKAQGRNRVVASVPAT